MSPSKLKKEIKWHNNWLSLTDECVGVIRDWCRKDSSENTFCRYCGSTFSFSSQGPHALKQYSETQTHKNNHKVVHDNKIPKIAPVFQSDLKAQFPSSSGYFSSANNQLLLSNPRLLTLQQMLKYCGCGKLHLQTTLLGYEEQ